MGKLKHFSKKIAAVIVFAAMNVYSFGQSNIITLDLSSPLNPTSFNVTPTGYFHNSNYEFIDFNHFSFSHILSSVGMEGFLPALGTNNSQSSGYAGCMAGGGIAVDASGNVITSGGVVQTNPNAYYLIGYWAFFMEEFMGGDHSLQTILTDADVPYEAVGVYVNESPAAYYNINSSSAFQQNGAKFKLIIHALNENYEDKGVSVEFILAENIGETLYHRAVNWTWVDLSSLGSVYGFYYTLESADIDPMWGMNTPSYFCLDKLQVRNPNIAVANHTIIATIGTEYSYEYYGSISPSSATQIMDGGSQTYTFTPNAGYHIGNVMVGSTDVTSEVQNNQFTITNIVSDTTINVMFAVDKNNTITANDIQYWVGDGANKAVLAVNWCEPETALAWGYKFDGASVLVSDVLNAIKAADSRFNYAEAGGFVSEISYTDGSVQLAISPDWVMYNVNEEPIYAGVTEQAVANSDVIEFGGYACYLTDDFGNAVWTTSITAVAVPTGIFTPQIDNAKFALYPNATKDFTTLQINGISGNIAMQIVDINGKIILSENIQATNNFVKTLNVSNLAKGVYFVTINNYVQKLIVY